MQEIQGNVGMILGREDPEKGMTTSTSTLLENQDRVSLQEGESSGLQESDETSTNQEITTSPQSMYNREQKLMLVCASFCL